MSYSNQTPYIGFPIRSAIDTFNTLDNNNAFEVADTKIKEAHDNAATAVTDAAAAVETAGEAKTIAEGAAGDIDRIDGTLDEHAERLVILSNRQTSQAAAIKTKAAATSIANLYDAESGTYAVDDLVVYDGQLYVCTTAVNVPEDFDPAKWDAKDVVSLLPSPGGSIDADDVSYNDTLTQLGASDVQDAIVALKALIDNIPIGGGTMVNFADKKYHFDASHLTFTANEDVFLFGCAGRAGDNLPSKLEFTYDGVTSEVAIKATATSPMIFNQFAEVIKAGTTITIINGSPAMADTALEVFGLFN